MQVQEQELKGLWLAEVGACVAQDGRNRSSWASGCQELESMRLRVVGLMELIGFKVAGLGACAAQYSRSRRLQPSGGQEQELVHLGWQNISLSGKWGGCSQSQRRFQYFLKIHRFWISLGKSLVCLSQFLKNFYIRQFVTQYQKYDLLKARFGCLHNALLNLQHHVYRDTAVQTCYCRGFLFFSMLLNQLPSLIEQRCRDTRLLIDWCPSCREKKPFFSLSWLSFLVLASKNDITVSDSGYQLRERESLTLRPIRSYTSAEVNWVSQITTAFLHQATALPLHIHSIALRSISVSAGSVGRRGRMIFVQYLAHFSPLGLPLSLCPLPYSVP